MWLRSEAWRISFLLSQGELEGITSVGYHSCHNLETDLVRLNMVPVCLGNMAPGGGNVLMWIPEGLNEVLNQSGSSGHFYNGSSLMRMAVMS